MLETGDIFIIFTLRLFFQFEIKRLYQSHSHKFTIPQGATSNYCQQSLS